jgi:hypothetical protein
MLLRESIETLLVVTAVTLGIVVCLALGPPSAGAMTRCEKLDGRYIKARDIRTFGGLGCVRARLVVARYFANISRGGICRDDRFTGGCAVTRFDCATTRPRGGGSASTGRCQTLDGRRVVRFLEYDHLPTPSPNGLTG